VQTGRNWSWLSGSWRPTEPWQEQGAGGPARVVQVGSGDIRKKPEKKRNFGRMKDSEGGTA